MEIQKFQIGLESLSDIMFDRFYDHSKTVRPPEQRFYLADGNRVILPNENLYSFLFAQKPPVGCAKAFEGRKAGNYLRVGPGHVFIDPVHIAFTKDDAEVCFDSFDSGKFYVFLQPTNTKGSGGTIKQEAKPRPVLRHPWSVEFVITLVKNPLIDEQKLYNWFSQGGLLVGLCNGRPRFGRFQIGKWEEITPKEKKKKK